MLQLKQDRTMRSRSMTMTEYLVQRLVEELTGIAGPYLSGFFGPDVQLVPVPSSSLLMRGGLWVPERLARSLVRHGLGKDVLTILSRTKTLLKAATAGPKDRPLAQDHYETISVARVLTAPPAEIVLVDDVVTRGATLLGAATRLQEAYPQARIRAWAAMRTISNCDEFKAIVDLRRGLIRLRHDGQTWRDP